MSHCLDEILNLCQSFSALLLQTGSSGLAKRELSQIDNITKVRLSDKIERQFISILQFLNKVHYGFEQVLFHSVTLSLSYRILN